MSKRKVIPPRKLGGSPSRGGGMPDLGALGGGRGGLGAMMAEMQRLQEEMEAAQASLADEIVESSVGGGMVSVRMSGANKLVGITIKPEVVDPDDVEMLQDLIVAAFTDASEKASALSEERMAPYMDQLNSGIGGLGGLF